MLEIFHFIGLIGKAYRMMPVPTLIAGAAFVICVVACASSNWFVAIVSGIVFVCFVWYVVSNFPETTDNQSVNNTSDYYWPKKKYNKLAGEDVDQLLAHV